MLELMKKAAAFFLLVISAIAFGQDQISWKDDYQLQISDFKSPATQIGNVNIYSLHALCGIQFELAMSNIEFMFTKNFNDKVDNIFNRDASSLVAPDSIVAADVVNYARFEFDLAELYARKLRKKLIEEKAAFSNVTFFRPFYDEIQKELIERDTKVGKETDLGRKKEKLKQLHAEVKLEIAGMPEFCRSCRLPKKKK